MLKLVSSSQALAADRAAEQECGYLPELLMEEAGIRLQDRLETLSDGGAWRKGSVVYLVGPGNNGGDALVMARQSFLRGRKDVAVVIVFEAKSDSCRYQEQLAHTAGVPCYRLTDPRAHEVLDSASLWVDGIWGTGLNRTVNGAAGEVIRSLEQRRGRQDLAVLAVDVPSGLWAGWALGDPVVRATWTLAPGWHKSFVFFPEQRPFLGHPLAVPLAFPRTPTFSAELIESDDLGRLLPEVSAFDHKGRRGRLTLVGGSSGMTGALVLAGRSAAAAGVGVVTLGTDDQLVPVVAAQVASFQVRGLEVLLSQPKSCDAWVVGPGWGRDLDRAPWLRAILATKKPLVIDADALDVWAGLGEQAADVPIVLTPHPGEFARLDSGKGPSVLSASRLAESRGVTVVLKGAVTWVISPGERWSVWDGPNPALGTAGSGDCLAGVIGAFLAAGLGAHEAACAGVLLHASAGRALANEQGWFLTDELPAALARISASCRMPSVPL